MITADDSVYISGPMTGIPGHNKPTFFLAEYLLRASYGCRVLNPARLPDGLGWTQYMRLDVEMLRGASVLVTLPGWENSRGARIETDLATMHGIELITLVSLLKGGRNVKQAIPSDPRGVLAVSPVGLLPDKFEMPGAAEETGGEGASAASSAPGAVFGRI